MFRNWAQDRDFLIGCGEVSSKTRGLFVDQI